MVLDLKQSILQTNASIVAIYTIIFASLFLFLYLSHRPSGTLITRHANDPARKLKPERGVTITLNDLVVDATSSPPQFLTHNKPAFFDLCSSFVVYPICTVENDAADQKVRSLLAAEGPLAGLDHRIITCSTVEGRISVVRQLDPMAHFETNKEVVSNLTGKVPNVVLMDHANSMDPGPFQNAVSVVKQGLLG